MELRVLRQFSHFRLGAFISGEIAEIPDEYASHLIDIGVAEAISPPQPELAEAENVNKRTRNRKP